MIALNFVAVSRQSTTGVRNFDMPREMPDNLSYMNLNYDLI